MKVTRSYVVKLANGLMLGGFSWDEVLGWVRDHNHDAAMRVVKVA